VGTRTEVVTMNKFTWKDKTYKFDASACYNGRSFIRLPDGTVLEVVQWLESLPPQPLRLREITKVADITATEAVAVD
jgi:hypothetical protein